MQNNNEIMEDYIILIICILILCCGFLVERTFFGCISVEYLIGVILFLVGLFVAFKIRGVGIIVLLTHSIIGLVLMILYLLNIKLITYTDGVDKYTFLVNIFSNAAVPLKVKLYLLLIFATFFVAVVYTIVYNLSKKLKENRTHIIKILSFYLIGLILCAFFPKMFPFLYE